MRLKSIEINSDDLNKLVSITTTGCEGDFYFYEINNEKKLLKIIRELNNRYTQTGLKNIVLLNQNYEELKKEFPEFVLPENLVMVDKELSGYTMEYIKGRTLDKYLEDITITFEDKINVLKKLGLLLERLSHSNNNISPIVLADLHEENIIVDENGNIKIIDLNGIYLKDNGVPNCKYLITDNGFYFKEPKYTVNCIGEVIPNYNTDILCYCMIIMNFITKSNFYRLRDYQINAYLRYLKIIDFPKEIIDCIDKLYSKEDNVNPYFYLDYLTEEMIEKAKMDNYNKVREELLSRTNTDSTKTANKKVSSDDNNNHNKRTGIKPIKKLKKIIKKICYNN